MTRNHKKNKRSGRLATGSEPIGSRVGGLQVTGVYKFLKLSPLDTNLHRLGPDPRERRNTRSAFLLAMFSKLRSGAEAKLNATQHTKKRWPASGFDQVISKRETQKGTGPLCDFPREKNRGASSTKLKKTPKVRRWQKMRRHSSPGFTLRKQFKTGMVYARLTLVPEIAKKKWHVNEEGLTRH